MNRIYQGTALNQLQPKKRISRRKILGGLAAIAGLAASGYGFKKTMDFLGDLPEEDVYALKVNESKVLHNRGDPLAFKSDVAYVEFRGTVFRLYPLKAKSNDGPEKLVIRAHRTYDPNENPDQDSLLRAVELFNIINTKTISLDNLVANEIKDFQAKIPATPVIREHVTYQVPVNTGYKSINDVLLSYKR